MINTETSNVYFDNGIIPFHKAQLNIASSAVLYGLSVYTVLAVNKTQKGLMAFRLKDHFKRLLDSSKIIGIDDFEKQWNYHKFEASVKELINANDIQSDVFVRASVHVNELLPGTKSRGLKTMLSLFVYPAISIVPKDGVRLKTSVWRRVPDYAIPARAKVNGAYVNSVLAKQDALDSGYDDCIFLDINGHVCELSAANIFLVKDGKIITPSSTSDLLEGINRRTLIELALDEGYIVEQRTVDLTELYVADEVFVCGTSAFVASVSEIDARIIGNNKRGAVTEHLGRLHDEILHGQHEFSDSFSTIVG